MKVLKTKNGNISLSFESRSMANLWPEETGLSKKLWVDDSASDRKLKHSNRRVKFGSWGDYVTITFLKKGDYKVVGNKSRKTGKDVLEVVKWIDLNYDLLVELYEGKISIATFSTRMKQV